jgi:hypothetical protein
MLRPAEMRWRRSTPERFASFSWEGKKRSGGSWAKTCAERAPNKRWRRVSADEAYAAPSCVSGAENGLRRKRYQVNYGTG